MVIDMTADNEQQPRIKMTSDEFKQYLAALSIEDKKILHTAFTGGVSHDTHTPARTARLFEMLQEIGLWEPSTEPIQTDEQRIEMYRQFGLEVEIPKGRCGFSENLMCAPYDGVPYCIDDHGQFFKNGNDYSLKRGIRHRQMMIERHHDKIKAVYEHCTTLDRGDIWVLSGGGLQLQVFFGCTNGYLAILSLSMEDAPAKTTKDLDDLSKKINILEPQFEHNEPLFKGLKIPGVKVKHFPKNTLEP